MVVVSGVVTVTVNSPEKIFLEIVGMPMFGEHLDLILDRLKDRWRMCRNRRDSPDNER